MSLVGKIRHIPPHEAQGPTIKTARRSQGLTQAQLGRAIAKTQQHVSLLERNERCAAGRTAQAIERALGIRVPLPRMLPEQYALGRLAMRGAWQEAEEEKQRRAAVPQFVVSDAMSPPGGSFPG